MRETREASTGGDVEVDHPVRLLFAPSCQFVNERKMKQVRIPTSNAPYHLTYVAVSFCGRAFRIIVKVPPLTSGGVWSTHRECGGAR